MKLLRWIAPVVLALALAGCATTKDIEVNDETLSLVYGYFDMKDAPSDLEWVSLKRYGLPDEKEKDKEGGWYTVPAKDGLFFHMGIRPGSYQVDRFGGTGGIPLLTRRPFEYDFGARGRNKTALRIQKPGVYFFGSHKYVNHAGKGLFAADRFEMKQAPGPSEKELLQRLVKEIESDQDLAKYKRQLKLAKQRLSQL